ncbi:MAG: Co2+/Mg2+ efflux protein ApaG [Parvibaculum sp.]
MRTDIPNSAETELTGPGGLYCQTTRSIRIEVEPVYLADQSDPAQGYYVWAYTVLIHNEGREAVQLRARYWQISDSHGQVHEVRGTGVVGEQPVILPGETYEYTSGTPLAAPSGIMVGTYRMETRHGESFEVAVPPFPLDCPHAERMIH